MKIERNSTIGSEWRKWDLHLHTKSSYDYDYKGDDADEVLCKSLEDSNISAVAITDHFKIDAERIKNLRRLASEIVFFPGVELRCDKGASNLHVILIFPETSNLDDLQNDFESIMIRSKKKQNDDDKSIHWSFEDIVEFASSHSALISVHAGRKSNGLDSEITNALPVNMAIKQDFANEVDIFEVGQLRDISNYKNIVFKATKEKPLIICSDNHNPSKYSSKEQLWIKADLTFEGLRQCILQPNERVFVGQIPPELDRAVNNRRNTISKIAVSKKRDAKNEENWFSFELPLNAGLVAIIGNKGSGKSALSDIIGHACKCSSMVKASFLNSKRFNKSPNRYANDYDVELTWGDGKSVTLNLGSEEPNLEIEYAQYLPQEYIEQVCNDLGSTFQAEIDKVIYSYINPVDKGDAHNLSDLVKKRGVMLETKSEDLAKSLDWVNKNIINLEEKHTKEYKDRIRFGFQKAEEDLARHDQQRPNEVLKPDPNKTNEEYKQKLNELDTEIDDLQKKVNGFTVALFNINEQITQGKRLIEKMIRVENYMNQVAHELDSYKQKFSISDEWPNAGIVLPISYLNSYLKDLDVKRNEINIRLNGSEQKVGLYSNLSQVKQRRAAHIQTANKEEQEYQNYVNNLMSWNEERTKIIGDTNTEGSLEYYKAEYNYLKNRLDIDYKNAINERYQILAKIFQLKRDLVQIYDDLYEPIQGEVANLINDPEGTIKFRAEVQLKDDDFEDTVLRYINQRYSGVFCGKDTAHEYLNSLVHQTSFNELNSLKNLIDGITKAVTEDYNTAAKKVPHRLEFYNYLFGLGFIDVTFKLKVGGRDLTELSPGERGIVLLIFYLALSKENTPMIIDQPEDNLDNQSVYSKLVPCIIAAKKKRQIIIVTHNPNIAIACDAEQIIYSKIYKDKNKFEYISGSIENEEIKGHVIDVLEGTMPAFDLRREKYLNK